MADYFQNEIALPLNSDEVPDFNDEFQVGRLVRGNFEFAKDHYLLPRIPTLEDPNPGYKMQRPY